VTLTQWPATMCPSCQEDMSVELDTDWRMCLRCRHEWHPSTTTGPTEASAAPVTDAVTTALASVPTFAPTDALAGYVAQARSTFLGATVLVHELEVQGTVGEITDDGECIVTFGSGYWVEVTPDQFTVMEPAPVDDAFAIQFGSLNMAVAAQVLRAGANTLTGPDDDRRLTVPPEGFLPDDPDALMVIEHGVAYTVAILALTKGIASDDLRALADALDERAELAKATEPITDLPTETNEMGSTDDDNRHDRNEAGEATENESTDRP
jgi:hypothetical protein